MASFMIAGGAVSCSGGDEGDEASGGSAGSGTGGVNLGGSSSTTGGSSGTTGGTSGTTGGAGGTGEPLPAGVCSNGMDDDGDGLIDGFDPECTGPFDNDEGTFATGIPGDNRDPNWQDCFFDGNSGAGDDDCRYHTDCLYGTLPATDEDCVLTQNCVEFCAERTPNGCDCFGCCMVTLEDGMTVNIATNPTCSLDNIDDLDACPRCEQSTECGNDCGECELCPGKTVDDLPEDCVPETDGGVPPPGYTCNEGQEVCGPDLPACPAGKYCAQGCCIISIQ